jgi:hypothetical protein
VFLKENSTTEQGNGQRLTCEIVSCGTCATLDQSAIWSPDRVFDFEQSGVAFATPDPGSAFADADPGGEYSSPACASCRRGWCAARADFSAE